MSGVETPRLPSNDLEPHDLARRTYSRLDCSISGLANLRGCVRVKKLMIALLFRGPDLRARASQVKMIVCECVLIGVGVTLLLF